MPLGNQSESGLPTWDLALDPVATSDDRFIGVFNPIGISRVLFGKRIFDSDITAPPRLDHLQYGIFVPEADTMQLLCSAFAFFVATRRSLLRKSRHLNERKSRDERESSSMGCYWKRQKVVV